MNRVFGLTCVEWSSNVREGFLLRSEWSLQILARFLMLLACVPLLQPPGVCICKTGALDCVSTLGAKVELNENDDSKPTCCNRHRTLDRNSSIPTPQPRPVPPDDSHQPGCPASAGVDRFKWVEPTATTVEFTFSIELVARQAFEKLTVSVARFPIDSVSHASPPLFLSHCSFVI